MIGYFKQHHKLSKQGLARWLALTVALAAVITFAAVSSKTSAASATLSLSPSSGSYQVGNSFSVAVNENSGTDGVNGVTAVFSYPQNLLQFVSIDGNSSGFGINSPSSGGGNGTVTISRASYSGLTGNQLVANVTFKVLAAGTASLTFAPVCQTTSSTNCIAVTSSTSNSNIASASSGASFTLQNPISSTPPPSPTPTPTPTTTTTPTTSTTSSTTNTTTSHSTFSSTTSSNSYTPPGSLQSVVVPNNGQIKTTQPVDVQPATVQVDGVKEVDYYLSKKLVYTSKTPPYAYQINTKHLLDGTYSLLAKTLYDSGRVSTSSQKLYVANPLSLEQLWLFIRHYLLIPIILVLAAVIAWKAIIHLKRMWWFGGGSSSGGDDTANKGGGPSGYNKQPEAPVIRPTTMVSQTETADDTSETTN